MSVDLLAVTNFIKINWWDRTGTPLFLASQAAPGAQTVVFRAPFGPSFIICKVSIPNPKRGRMVCASVGLLVVTKSCKNYFMGPEYHFSWPRQGLKMSCFGSHLVSAPLFCKASIPNLKRGRMRVGGSACRHEIL